VPVVSMFAERSGVPAAGAGPARTLRACGYRRLRSRSEIRFGNLPSGSAKQSEVLPCRAGRRRRAIVAAA
jgi:hypothetical protein